MPDKKCLLGCGFSSTLYAFPDDEERRERWLKIINMEYETKRCIYLCTQHFSSEMFANSRLSKFAYPDMNLVVPGVNSILDEEDYQYFIDRIVLEDSEEDESTTVSTQETSTASQQQPIKMVVVPQHNKIAAFEKATEGDPLSVPKMRPIASKPASDHITEASRRVKKILKARAMYNQSVKSQTPFAPVELRLATKRWIDRDEPNLPKLPTLSTRKPVQRIDVSSTTWKEKVESLKNQGKIQSQNTTNEVIKLSKKTGVQNTAETAKAIDVASSQPNPLTRLVLQNVNSRAVANNIPVKPSTIVLRNVNLESSPNSATQPLNVALKNSNTESTANTLTKPATVPVVKCVRIKTISSSPNEPQKFVLKAVNAGIAPLAKPSSIIIKNLTPESTPDAVKSLTVDSSLNTFARLPNIASKAVNTEMARSVSVRPFSQLGTISGEANRPEAVVSEDASPDSVTTAIGSRPSSTENSSESICKSVATAGVTSSTTNPLGVSCAQPVAIPFETPSIRVFKIVYPQTALNSTGKSLSIAKSLIAQPAAAVLQKPTASKTLTSYRNLVPTQSVDLTREEAGDEDCIMLTENANVTAMNLTEEDECIESSENQSTSQSNNSNDKSINTAAYASLLCDEALPDDNLLKSTKRNAVFQPKTTSTTKTINITDTFGFSKFLKKPVNNPNTVKDTCDLPTVDPSLKRKESKLELKKKALKLINEELFDETMQVPSSPESFGTNEDTFDETMQVPSSPDSIRFNNQSRDATMQSYNFNNNVKKLFEEDTEEEDDEGSFTKCKKTQTGTQSKYACGLIEVYSEEGRFNMSCFYCTAEFAIWDWHHFLRHLKTNHNFLMQPLTEDCIRETSTIVENQDPKFRNKRKQAPVFPEYKCPGDLGALLPNENIQYVLVKGKKPHTVALAPLEEVARNTKVDIKNINDWPEDDDYADFDDANEPDSDDEFYKAIIKKPEVKKKSRLPSYEMIDMHATGTDIITEFLELLKEHPLLWYKRKHGPTIYDAEAEKLMFKFSYTLTLPNFHLSMDNVRAWYQRLIKATPDILESLTTKPNYLKYLGLCCETVELSKTFALNCDHCKYYFLEQELLDTHKYLEHKIGELLYSCRSCGLRFPDLSKKEEHEITHQPKPLMICELCGMLFYIKLSFERHMRKMHPETMGSLRYDCPKCDRKFINKSQLAWHIRRHEPPPFKCEICNKGFYQHFNLKVHMKGHLNQRDYVCEICGMAFVSKKNLLSHTSRKHDIGGYLCEPCNRYFTTNESLSEHRIQHHPVGSNPVRAKNIYVKKDPAEREKYALITSRKFRCKQCGKTFGRQYELLRHRQFFGHGSHGLLYKCTHCTVQFKSHMNLVKHLQTIHKLPITTKNINYADYFIGTQENFEQKELEIPKPYAPQDENEEENEEQHDEEMNINVDDSEMDGFVVQTMSFTGENEISIQDEVIEEIFEDIETEQ